MHDLNDRNWVLVTIPVDAGKTLDTTSVTDLAAEFSLSGPGLGSVVLDASRAPIQATGDQFYFFVTGRFGTGDVSRWRLGPDGSPQPTAISPRSARSAMSPR